jgi:predicted SAM-dependent methyltransferase
VSVATETITRLDLGCGQSPKDGFTGVDLYGDPDVRLDLFSFPWPWDDGSVDEIFTSHVVEHIPHRLLEWPRNVDGLHLFMNEAHRILKPSGKLEIVHPYGLSARALQDPSHERYIVSETWFYYNREWREKTKLDHYPITADFEVEGVANSFLGDWGNTGLRSDEATKFAAGHYWNVVADLQVTLRALKPKE